MDTTDSLFFHYLIWCNLVSQCWYNNIINILFNSIHIHNWKSEISHVANIVAKSIGIISKCSFILPKTFLRMLYYSLIYPYFYYCNIVWASTYKTNLSRLVILQKRIIRIINKSHFNAHTDPIFKGLGILKFNDIYLLQLGQFVFSQKFLPPRFNNNLSQSNQFHSYNTRNFQA